jgi:hypothetical protein
MDFNSPKAFDRLTPDYEKKLKEYREYLESKKTK